METSQYGKWKFSFLLVPGSALNVSCNSTSQCVTCLLTRCLVFLLVSQFSSIDASGSSEWFSTAESITASPPGHPGTGGVPATPPTDGFPSIGLGSGCPFVGP